MGGDSSLQERGQTSAYYLLRSKGKYRDRLIDIALNLGPLQSRDFTQSASKLFDDLKNEVESLRSGIDIEFGHFNDPTPNAKKRIARLMLELLKACVVAEAKYEETLNE